MLPENPPLGGSYPLRVTLALLALCPNIVLGAAAALLQPDLVHDLGAGRTALSVAEGLSTAGYAFGAVLAVALAKRIEPRRLLLVYESLFVVGSVLAAVSPDVVVFGVGRDLQGLATGMLLVAALPPTVTSFPAAKLATTVAVIDVGLFGAVTLGPLVGGVGAATGGWRWVFVIAGLLAAAAIAIIVASVPPGDPMDPDGPIDKTALPLALGSTVLLFLASGLVVGAPIVSVEVLVPLALGLVLLVTLVVTQYVRENPLTPVRLISHTVPATGLGAAMFAGAAAGSLLALLGVYSSQVLGRSPLELAVGAGAGGGAGQRGVRGDVPRPARPGPGQRGHGGAAVVRGGGRAARVVRAALAARRPRAGDRVRRCRRGRPGAVPGGSGGVIEAARAGVRPGGAAAQRGGLPGRTHPAAPGPRSVVTGAGHRTGCLVRRRDHRRRVRRHPRVAAGRWSRPAEPGPADLAGGRQRGSRIAATG